MCNVLSSDKPVTVYAMVGSVGSVLYNRHDAQFANAITEFIHVRCQVELIDI